MRQRFLMLTVRYINTNETYYFLRISNFDLIAMDSIADILRDFVSIWSTSNNLTVYCL